MLRRVRSVPKTTPPVPSLMTFDPARWRMDTAAALAGRIHLNNAGAALMPQPVVDAINGHIAREVHLGGYEAEHAVRAAIEQTYADVARLIGAEPRNVAVVENATAAFAQALSAFDFERGDVILTTQNDYISNQLMYLSLAGRQGVQVVRAEDLPEGGVDPQSLRELLLKHRPKLVAVTWIPTNSGLVQPVAEVGRICAEHDVPYLIDACQAVGQIDIDLRTLHCDFLSATARKFLRGPRGVGFLYVSDRMLEQQRAPLLIDMRGADWLEDDVYELRPDARRFENWEFAWALVLGLGAAARYAMEVGVAEAGAYAAGLAATLREALRELPGARVLDRGEKLCAIATVALPNGSPADIVAALREQAINTSATGRHATEAVRISPHYYNTPQEVAAAVAALEAFT